MISNYEIKKINNEEVLYLYLDLDTEFALSNLKEKKDKLEEIIIKYIKDNKIVFKGTTVVLAIGTVILGNLKLNDNVNGIDNVIAYVEDIDKLNTNYINDADNIIKNIENNISNIEITDNINPDTSIDYEESINQNEDIINIEQEDTNNNANKINNTFNTTTISNSNENNITNVNNNIDIPTTNEEIITEEEEDNNIYITIQRANGQIITLELEEYVIGVVGAEMPASFHEQALMSQAIISRTYALKAMTKSKILSDSESTQSYKTNDELKAMWGSNYNTYYNKIKQAVNATKGMYLTYNGAYIEAVFHSTSNGKTESSTDVWGNYYPYLISVDSPYDSLNPSFIKEKEITYEELSKLLDMDINIDTSFNILTKTKSGRVDKIEINEKVYKATTLRNILSLRSTDFEIIKTETSVIFKTKGYGHGVGLSQYGANGMAKNGYSYAEILSHYYNGTTINHL